VVTGPVGVASAVLLRAGEVVKGLDVARSRRRSARLDRDLARGPARLAQALGVDGRADGTPLLSGGGPILLLPPSAPVDAVAIAVGPRVGVNGGAERPWRFWLTGEPTVSPYRRHVPRRTSVPGA